MPVLTSLACRRSVVSTPEKLPLTVAVIALNAEARIGELLASVGFADEVLVVDSGSTDATVSLAEARGARVIRRDWLGFGRQKQFAVSAARNDWVLCLDVDERVTPELEKSIELALAGGRFKAWRMARRNRFLGAWLSHGEGYPDWTLRLFNRSHASWSNDEVHEAVLTTAEVGRLDGDLLHDSVEDVATYMAKQYRYTTLHAEALYRQGVRASYARLFVNPLVRFLKFYFFKLGFLDGGPGFAHVVIGCNNTFHKYLKLIELQKAGR
ncbi:MAG: glycosyltransferase family 2 protein [Betaproteobacteria bacterium]|nr:glycosyltransferase family 2 protein [Betaproteobacteria bacterium]